MPTRKQLAERRKYLTSTDAARILCMGQGAQVQAEKLHDVEDKPPNAAMLAGTYFERGILKWAENELGPLRRNQFRVYRSGQFPLASHIDALTVDGDPVEAKSSLLLSRFGETWGEDGTDQVPDRVIVQCYVHMLVTDTLAGCHVPAFIGGRGFAMFHVPWVKDRGHELYFALQAWWRKHIIDREPCPVTDATLDVLRRIRRTPGKTISLPLHLGNAVTLYTEAKRRIKLATEIRDQAQAALVQALGDAEVGTLDGIGEVRYAPVNVKGYTVQPRTDRRFSIKETQHVERTDATVPAAGEYPAIGTTGPGELLTIGGDGNAADGNRRQQETDIAHHQDDAVGSE